MPKCVSCGKKGLFLNIDVLGNCSKCAENLANRKREEALRKKNSPVYKTLFDISFPDETLRYKYTDVKLESSVIYPESFVRVGTICGFFRMEEGSEHIEVKVILGEEDLLIGFLPSGKLSNMAGDWFDRSWTSGGQVSSIKDGSIYIDMAFWTPDDER